MLAIYTRLSQEDDNSNSIENQIREGKSYAAKCNMPFQIYNEGQGVSGRNEIKDRPKLDQLMKDMKVGNISTVWMRNQNRLERNSMTFHVFANLVRTQNIKVVIGEKEMDWNDPSNFLQSSIMTAINSYQAELQSFQTKKSLLDNAKEGKAFGIIPYGYKADDKGFLVINDEEVKTVKRIYELSLSGKGTKSIADLLNDEGVPTRYATLKEGSISTVNKHTGKVTTRSKTDVKWAGNTVRGIIANTIYKGDRNWGDNIFEAPAIFDSHYWQKVNDNLKNNSNNRGKSVEHKYMLKGILECAICGRNYYGRTRQNKKDNYYMCSSKRHKHETCTNRSINIDVLESFVWETLFEDEGMYQKMVQTFKSGGTEERRKELRNLITSHKQALKDLEQERNRMVQKVVKGILEDEEVGGERLRITKAENDYRERLKKDGEELYELESETRILEDITTDFNLHGGTLFFEENPVIKEKIIVNKRRRERLKNFNPAFNDKSRLIKKYIRRIFIVYDKENRIYTLEIKYNLPLPDETYLIDSNYIYAYNAKKKEFTKWYFDYGRSFTPAKTKETHDKLINYASAAH